MELLPKNKKYISKVKINKKYCFKQKLYDII